MGHDSPRPVWPAQLSGEIGNISWRFSCGSELTVFRKRGPKLSARLPPPPVRTAFLRGAGSWMVPLMSHRDWAIEVIWMTACSGLWWAGPPPGKSHQEQGPLWNSEPQTAQYDTILPKARNYSFSVYTSWCPHGLSLGPSGLLPLPPFHGYNHHPYTHVSQGWTPAVFLSESQPNTT